MPASLIAQLIAITSFGSSFNPPWLFFLVIFLHKDEQIYYLHIYAKSTKKVHVFFLRFISISSMFFVELSLFAVYPSPWIRALLLIPTSFPLPLNHMIALSYTSQPYVWL